MYVWMYVWCIYVWMYVCVYVCACMYICMHVNEICVVKKEDRVRVLMGVIKNASFPRMTLACLSMDNCHTVTVFCISIHGLFYRTVYGNRGAQIPGASSPWWLNFIRWRLLLVSRQYGTGFMSTAVWGGSLDFWKMCAILYTHTHTHTYIFSLAKKLP
jgi:hypothetical protein